MSGASDSVALLTTKLKEAEKQQNQLIVQLSEAKMQCSQLAEDEKSQEQQVEELKADIVLLKTKLRGVGLVGGVAKEPMLSIPPPSTCPMVPSVMQTPPRVSWVSTGTSGAAATLTSSTTVPSVCATSVLSVPASSPIRTTTPTTALSSLVASLPPPIYSGVSTPSGVGTSVSSSVGVSLLPSTLTMPSRPSPSTTPLVSDSTAPATPHVTVPLYAFPPTYLASHMSPMPQFRCFSGDESGDGDLFQDWLEQFESAALLGGWGEHGRLVNLTTRLSGTAYTFYRSCSPEQQSSYPLLVAALKKRFTPVQLTAIHTQTFHDRVQKEKESVNEFAQALRKLFNKAYSTVVRGEPEANWQTNSSLVYAPN